MTSPRIAERTLEREDAGGERRSGRYREKDRRADAMPHVPHHTPVAGMPVRSILRGAVISFHCDKARLTAPFGSRGTNCPWPCSVLISFSTIATLPRVKV